MVESLSDSPESGPLVHSASELLVAELDLHILDFCRDIAGPLGMLTQSVEDAEAMLELLESGFVDLLLLSEQFPGNTGFEILRHIRYWYPETHSSSPMSRDSRRR